ncbi:hypothetical protein EHE19_018080 [Ruminiclostridium herbifermentans]|uniref:Uncharacterized protein n=1 Tax=Ruminiclostridium herbifermentans TaxID=2488810 RepID=A0A4U7JIF3_9FIRM|nr:hypothetical protein [Ruminiclostridium herbifermentans]QNU66723.1 hypothetical protein EHE19_018080 [Ruminiclostridium herbifermentans]
MPAKLYSEDLILKCAHCGKNLFENIGMSIVVLVQDMQNNKISDIYTCCKGNCDDILQKHRVTGSGSDGWKELSEFTNPFLFLKHVMAIMNNMHDGIEISQTAFESYKEIVLATAQYVMRDLTTGEKESVRIDSMLPF